jgi:uncharacterized membrane protein YfcA
MHGGMSPLVMLAVIVVGFASGVLSGMFGVGGAVLTTPGIRVFGATPIEGVGSTIPAILPGSLSGAWRYGKAGLVDWHVALPSGLLGSTFAVVGAELSDHVNAHYLMILTAGLLLWSGLKNVHERVRMPAPAAVPVGGPAAADATATAAIAPRPSFGAVAAIGSLSGLLAGLLGVGGGILLVPAYTRVLRIPPKRAVATSLVAVAMFSIPAMITHAWLGHINWTFALLLVAGVVPGAQVGARLTIHGSEARLRLLMGCFFVVIAIMYGAGEILSL